MYISYHSHFEQQKAYNNKNKTPSLMEEKVQASEELVKSRIPVVEEMIGLSAPSGLQVEIVERWVDPLYHQKKIELPPSVKLSSVDHEVSHYIIDQNWPLTSLKSGDESTLCNGELYYRSFYEMIARLVGGINGSVPYSNSYFIDIFADYSDYMEKSYHQNQKGLSKRGKVNIAPLDEIDPVRWLHRFVMMHIKIEAQEETNRNEELDSFFRFLKFTQSPKTILDVGYQLGARAGQYLHRQNEPIIPLVKQMMGDITRIEQCEPFYFDVVVPKIPKDRGLQRILEAKI